MLGFAEMLIGAARLAGIKVPEDARHFDRDAYPHWYAFCALQLGQSMPYPGVHFDNALVIAEVPEGLIFDLTVKDILDRGFQVGMPVP